MLAFEEQTDLKARVQAFWNEESCGERYGVGEGVEFYDAHAHDRYTLEPWIKPFARFAEGRDKRVLEVGVGMGADYLEWLKAGADAYGLDFTPRGVAHTQRRCALHGVTPKVTVGDAENLPYPDNSFDLVYSWGVVHHSPDTAKCFREIARVLRPGGRARIAIYHLRSWGVGLIWARNGLLRGKLQGPRRIVADNMESPGTKLYTIKEAREELCAPFPRIVEIRTQLGLGDLLTMKPSAKYADPLSQFVLKVYPRGLIRRLGHRFGGYLLIECEK